MAGWQTSSRGFLARLTEAARVHNPRDEDRSTRTRRMTEFMAWSFLLSHEIDKLAAFFSSARAAGTDGIDIEPATAGGDGQASTAFDGMTFDGADAVDAAMASASQVLAGLERVNSISAEGGFQSAVMSAPVVQTKLTGAPANVSLKSTQSLDVDAGSPVAPIPAAPPVIPQIAVLPGFNGLTTFLDGYGLGRTTTSFDSEGLGAAKGPVSAALDFAETPMTTLGFWAASGDLALTSVPLTTDGLSVEWLVQANGHLGDTVTSVNEARGFSAGDIQNETLSSGIASQSNVASVVDGQDWTGLLEVKGNYYEFNTVIQINVVWDRDKVTLNNAAAPESGANHVIDTGGNEQINEARILDPVILEPDVGPDTSELDALLSVDAGQAGAPYQVVAGGQAEYFSVMQINSLVDVDKIDFNASDVFAELGLSSDLGVFADVKAAGASQANDSLIDSSAADPLGLGRLKDLINVNGPMLTTTISGNYYEFNTIVQVNVLYDDDVITDAMAQWGPPGASQGNGVMASGGNLQFNFAQIQKADNLDYLFVHGSYSEYNLVLQLNAIDDSDTIFQSIGLPGGPGGTANGLDLHLDGMIGDAGLDGIGANMFTPAMLGDLGVRGSDLMP
jgi:hypothetical protein